MTLSAVADPRAVSSSGTASMLRTAGGMLTMLSCVCLCFDRKVHNAVSDIMMCEAGQCSAGSCSGMKQLALGVAVLQLVGATHTHPILGCVTCKDKHESLPGCISSPDEVRTSTAFNQP